MQRPDLHSQQAQESLAGCWHSIGVLELRRLLLEGASIVLQESDTPTLPMGAGTIVVPENVNAEILKWCIHDLEAPLVCVAPGCGPAERLAAHLYNEGCQHIFTPETDWGGIIDPIAANGEKRH